MPEYKGISRTTIDGCIEGSKQSGNTKRIDGKVYYWITILMDAPSTKGNILRLEKIRDLGYQVRVTGPDRQGNYGVYARRK